MFDLRRARTRKVSVRSIIAVAGVTMATLGVAQATGTMANPSDAVTTTGSQVATGNFYPTPLTASIGCDTTGSVTGQRGNPYWSAVPGATGYKVELMNRNNHTVKDTKTFGANELKWSGISDNGRNGLYVRVYTINGPVTSSGYATGAGMSFKDWVSGRTACEGSNGAAVANKPWENTTIWDPSTPAPVGNPLARGGSDNQAQRMAPQMDVTEDTEAVESTTTEAPTTTTEAPVTTTEAPTTTPSTEPTTPTTTPPSTSTTTPETTPTEDPKPELSDTVENGGLTAGWMKGGNKVAVVDAEGNELASGRVEKGSALHWHNGQLWVVGDTKVYRIMESPQDGTWKFYNDSGQNMPDFG